MSHQFRRPFTWAGVRPITDFSQDWINDCMLLYGRVLKGDYAHWCPEYDDMPIDENSEEFESCTCSRWRVR